MHNQTPLRYTLPLPPSINKIYIRNQHSRRLVFTHTATDWEDDAYYRMTPPPTPLSIAPLVELDFYYADNRRRDPNNYLKLVFDVLVKRRIVSDDCWQVLPRFTVTGQLDRLNPRLEITIHDH